VHNLLETGMKNAGKKSIFSEIIIIDFYDGPTQAVCKIISSNDWVISSLVYFDPDTSVRIFSIISMPNDWLNKFESDFQLLRNNNFKNYEVIKTNIKRYSENYSGEVFLFKCEYLSSDVYSIVQINSNKLLYFDSVESVVTQNKQSQSKWIEAFLVN
jgi:hypothetical protein